MKTTQSTYLPQLGELPLAKVDAALAAMPATATIDQINWPDLYPAAPQTTFTLAHTDHMLYVRYEVKGEVPLSTKTNDLELVNDPSPAPPPYQTAKSRPEGVAVILGIP